ncbi:transporter substrate-binding domain-containing protein [Desulfovibrio ferrophilus]|uniref:Glutamine ABC transporter, periplasmic glutamine-binding protein n=1 Tax=Desulfovibrio ferrophilus TaxID=241368 RepID=A0A2Z6AW95_9BACT|nr:transporter substrate-binding domain-containing protein [Desulfovibrio ferrophilus]BBD07490.1 glutamine ABC transporter, periplasmic glutamine-binding protein [Desulfovibrio ferrophilus]
MPHIISIALTILLLLASQQADAQDITVGMDDNYEPFSFIDKTSYSGFDVDIMSALCDIMGIGFTIKPMPFQDLVPALRQGKLDAAMAGIAITDKRTSHVAFSDPYFHGGQRMLVAANTTGFFTVDGLKGKNVGTKLGSDGSFFLYDNVPDATVSLFPHISDAYDELIHGRLDAIFFDSSAIGYFAMTKGKDKVRPLGPLYESQPYGIALPKDSLWIARFNDALWRIRENGTYKTIYYKWFGELPDDH